MTENDEADDDDRTEPLDEVRHALRERVKELTCLYDVSAILADEERSIDERHQAVVDAIPAGWQVPGCAAARLTVDDKSFTSSGWSEPRHELAADVRVGGEPVGRLRVIYTDDVPERDGDAFLGEERLLLAELALRVSTSVERERGRRRTRPPEARRQEDVDAAPGSYGLVGESPAMREVLRAIEKSARTDATILIHGESGTGKELVARAIHYASRRASSPFVPVNCAAIPENLVESELFGHVKGAFTGATHTRAGFFQVAQGGTVFLDEIGEMQLGVQAKLLRVLENDELRMVGSDKTLQIDARIIAATNKDLSALVRVGRFRADLFFRLNVLSLELPPLRDRGDDLVLLLDEFQRKWGARSGGRVLRFSDDALAALRRYDWPGNVRELENLVHRLTVMADRDQVEADDLPGPMRTAPPRPPRSDARTLQEVEREHVRHVLDSVDGNRTQAARILGIDRKTLRKKLDGSGA